MAIYQLDQHVPQIDASAWIAKSADVMGAVSLAANTSVWFNAVIRGDVHSIRIGNQTNIQDGAIIHCTYKRAPTSIGNQVSIGHMAMVHGCTIEDRVLIGMGAIILDRAVVQEGCLVAAGAVVTEGSILEAGYLYAGIPAKKIKPVSNEQKEVILQTAVRYPEYAAMYGPI